MEDLVIEVCVCTECVMDGAMDIMESIDELKEIYGDLQEDYDTDIKINVIPVKCLGEAKHGDHSPRVSINGEILENANNQTVMAEIIKRMKRDMV